MGWAIRVGFEISRATHHQQDVSVNHDRKAQTVERTVFLKMILFVRIRTKSKNVPSEKCPLHFTLSSPTPHRQPLLQTLLEAVCVCKHVHGENTFVLPERQHIRHTLLPLDFPTLLILTIFPYPHIGGGHIFKAVVGIPFSGQFI